MKFRSIQFSPNERTKYREPLPMGYMGIDPGGSGGIAVLGGTTPLETFALKSTERDISDFIVACTRSYGGIKCVIEKVGAMPKQGVSSTFKFGQSYGFLRGVLISHGVSFREVRPQEWQKIYSMKRKRWKDVNGKKCEESKTDWKNRLKAKAQQMEPNIKVTHAIADAILIAHYCKAYETGSLNI